MMALSERDRLVLEAARNNDKNNIQTPTNQGVVSTVNRDAQVLAKAREYDRNNLTVAPSYRTSRLKSASDIGGVSKEQFSAAKTPLLSGTDYEEPSALDRIKNLGTAVGGSILQGADAAATGISSTLDFLVGRPLQALGWENNPASWLNDKLQSEREANAEYFSQQLDNDKAAQTVLDLGTAVSRAAWELPLIIMTGGASKAAQAGTKGLQATAALESTLQSSGIGQTVTNAVNLLQRQLRNPQTWQSFASTTGQAYEDAKAQGASEASATAYAVINGLLGSLVEVGGGGIQELPDVLRQPSLLRNWIDTMLDEGKEEVVQGVIDRLTQNVTGVANNPIVGSQDENAVLNLGTALEEFGGGTLVGGILGGGQIGVDAALNRIRGNASQNAADAPTADAVTQTGVDTSTGVNPVEAGIDASVRLFNEGGGVIGAQTPGDSRYMKESAPETIKTVVPSQSEARGGSGAPTERAPDNIKTGVTAQDGVTGGSGTLSNNSIPDSGQNVNGQESHSTRRATQEGTFDTRTTPADASIPSGGANVNALADSMTDEQLTLEQQRNNADIASINDVLNAAQGGQQFPQGIIDQLTGQLPGLMQEQQRLASVEQAKRVQRGEVSRSFGQPENHIDNRNPDSVKGNRVAAFSFDHPQLHGYFVQAARDLQGMADYAAEAERGRSNRGNRIDRERNRSAVKHAYSRELRNAMESGDLSKPQVLDACQRIIDNHGHENVLAAKRVELILDDMLTNGYTTADGVDVAPNMEYIAAKEQIAGARGAERAIERYDDDLAIGAFGMPYTDAELAEQEAERQRIREQYAALNQPAAQTSQNGEVSATDSTGAAPRGFSVGHAPEYAQNQEHAISNTMGEQYEGPGRHEVLHNRDSMYYAQQRVGVDFEGEMADLRNKQEWDAIDIDTGMLILERLKQESMRAPESATARAAMREWKEITAQRATTAGQSLNAFGKWAGFSAENAYSDAVDVLYGDNVQRGVTDSQKQEILRQTREAAERLEEITPEDTASTIELIKRLSQQRHTTGILRNDTSPLMNRALEHVAQQEGGAEFLRNVAQSQIHNLARDYERVSLTERMRTLRALNLLSKPATTLRNLIGNTVFDPLESISNNTGVVFDWLIGQLTGQRTMALDQSWFSEAKRRGSVDALMRSIVEIGLDADAEGVENRYEQGGGRTFRMTGNFIERLLSTWEKINGYMLTSTDEFAKGGVRAEAQRGLEALQERNANVSDEYITSRADEIARQRTFQNDSVASDLMLRGRNALNAVHVGDIGLGDVMLPFARVPANVATQAINYSPAGIVNGVGQFARTMWNARRGTLTPEQQAQAATALGRGLTGTAGIAAFAALALKGILNVAGSDDQDEAALDTGEGMSGTQLNLSALMRLLNGESTEWRDGDQLMSIGFLEPINALMAMGSMVADSYTEDGTLDARDILNASLEGTIQSVLDLPAMSSIQELMNAWQYAAGEDTTERVVNAALSYAGSQLPGFVIPNLVAGIASGLDNTVRAPYLGETAEDDLVNQFLADIPGLRENVPARLDSWGNERTYSDSDVLNFLNSTILPGSVTQYHTNSVNQEIRRLGNFPQRSAPGDFSIDGEKITLTQEQKDAYQQAYGDAALSVLEPLMASSTYQSLSDEEKNKVIDSVYEYANAAAKQTIDNRYKLEGAAAKASEYDNPGEYFLFNEAWKVIEDSKGANTAAFEAVMQDYERMSTQKQNALMDALGENTRFDDVAEAYEAGLSPAEWYTAYDEYRALEADEDSTAAVKATDFAKWLDTESGFNEQQRSLLEEQFGFYTHLRADTERYDDLIAAGFTPDKANAVYDAVSALQPQTGKTQVSDVQRYAAIAGLNNLTDQEKVAALTEYEGAGSGEKQKFKTAAGYGITPDEFVDFLELREAGDYDYNYSGKGSHNYDESEATDLVNAFLEMYPDTSNQKAAVLWSMVNSSKSGNPYYNFNADMIQWDKAP